MRKKIKWSKIKSLEHKVCAIAMELKSISNFEPFVILEYADI